MNNKPTYEELELKIKSLEAKLLLQELLKDDIKINSSFLKMLFDTIPSPMFYKDIDGVYQHCNDAFSKTILGIPKEKIIGKTLYDLPDVIPKEYADIYYEKDKALFDNPGTQFYEGKVKCSDEISRDYHFYKSTFVVDEKVKGLVGLMLDVSDYKSALAQLDEKNKELNSLSITDCLTDLNNRRYFEKVFTKKLKYLSRNKQDFSFALIDIDFFKNYNDAYGHQLGDIALQKVAEVLRKTMCRSNDYVFRLGGEEFGVLFDVSTEKDALMKMESLRMNIEKLYLKTSNTSTSEYLTISIGLGNILQVGRTFDSSYIYNEVDKLLYTSKNNGRNQVTCKNITLS